MRTNPWKVTTFVLAGALAIALALPAITSADAGNPQPHMKAALSATRTAKRQLNKAAHNKGGHRAKALQLVTQAEAEIEKGIAVGNR